METGLNHEDLSVAIRDLRDLYIKENKAKSAFDINCGICYQFADDIITKLGHIEDYFFETNIDFFKVIANEDGDVDGTEDWDTEFVENEIGIRPPLPWKEVNKIDFGYHVWIVLNNRHYDAECPDGVDSFFELPFFERKIEEYARNES